MKRSKKNRVRQGEWITLSDGSKAHVDLVPGQTLTEEDKAALAEFVELLRHEAEEDIGK